ncbi:MAG: LysM peptidoglycan-binding domain-containing protein [Muribaculaceae bacterium]|nr:LysM peptidoglycan-binding domain-containing protein [Muribaculaceae bacterium]
MSSQDISLGKGKNLININLSGLKGGIRREQLQTENEKSIFDSVDTNKDGVLQDNEVQQLAVKLAEAAGKKDETNLSNGEAKDFLKGAGLKDIKKEDLFKFVQNISQSSDNIKECKTDPETNNVIIEYNDGTIETIRPDKTSTRTQTDGEGTTTTVEYNANGQPLGKTIVVKNGKDGTATIYQLDAEGNPVKNNDGEYVPAQTTVTSDEGKTVVESKFENGIPREQTTTTEDSKSVIQYNESGVPAEQTITKEGSSTVIKYDESGHEATAVETQGEYTVKNFTYVNGEPREDSRVENKGLDNEVSTTFTYNEDGTVIERSTETNTGKTSARLTKDGKPLEEQSVDGNKRTIRQYTEDGSSVETIQEGENVTQNQLNPEGQRLTQVKVKNGKQYQLRYDGNGNTEGIIVQCGETPAAIAKKFGVPLNKLLEVNKDKLIGKGKNRSFRVGDSIKIPRELEADAKVLQGRDSSAQAVAKYQKLLAERERDKQLRAMGLRDYKRAGEKFTYGGKQYTVLGTMTNRARLLVADSKGNITVASWDKKILKDEYVATTNMYDFGKKVRAADGKEYVVVEDRNDGHGRKIVLDANGRAMVLSGGNSKTDFSDRYILRNDYVQASDIYDQTGGSSTVSSNGVKYVKDKQGKVWYVDSKTGKFLVKNDYSNFVQQEATAITNTIYDAAHGWGTDEDKLKKGVSQIYSPAILAQVNTALAAKDSDYRGDAHTMPLEALILDEETHGNSRQYFRTLINNNVMSNTQIGNTVARELQHEVEGGLFGYTSTASVNEVMNLLPESNRDARLATEASLGQLRPDLVPNEGSLTRAYLAKDGWNAQEVDQFDSNWVANNNYAPGVDQAHRNAVIGRLVFGYDDQEALHKGLRACNDDPNSLDYQFLSQRAAEENAARGFEAHFTGQESVQTYLAGRSNDGGEVDVAQLSACNTLLFKSTKPPRVQAEEALYAAKKGDMSNVFASMDPEVYDSMQEIMSNGDIPGCASVEAAYKKAMAGANAHDKTSIKANAILSGHVNFSQQEITAFCVELMHSIDTNRGDGGSTGISAERTNDADYQTEQLKAILSQHPEIIADVKAQVEAGNFSYTTRITSGGGPGTQPTYTSFNTNTKDDYLNIINNTNCVAQDEVFLDEHGKRITDPAQIKALKEANNEALSEMRKYVAELEREFKMGVDEEGWLDDAGNALVRYSGIGTDRGDVANRYREAKRLLKQLEAAAQGKLRDSKGNVISAQQLAQGIIDKEQGLAQVNADYKSSVGMAKMGIVLAPVILVTTVATGGLGATGWAAVGVGAGTTALVEGTMYGTNLLTSETGNNAENRAAVTSQVLQDTAFSAAGIKVGQYAENFAVHGIQAVQQADRAAFAPQTWKIISKIPEGKVKDFFGAVSKTSARLEQASADIGATLISKQANILRKIPGLANNEVALQRTAVVVARAEAAGFEITSDTVQTLGQMYLIDGNFDEQGFYEGLIMSIAGNSIGHATNLKGELKTAGEVGVPHPKAEVPGAPHVDGGTHVDGGAHVDGGTHVDGDVHVDGGTHVDGDVHVDGGRHVDGDGTHVDGDVHVDGGTHVDGDVHVDGGTHVDGDVHVDGGRHVDGDGTHVDGDGTHVRENDGTDMHVGDDDVIDTEDIDVVEVIYDDDDFAFLGGSAVKLLSDDGTGKIKLEIDGKVAAIEVSNPEIRKIIANVSESGSLTSDGIARLLDIDQFAGMIEDTHMRGLINDEISRIGKGTTLDDVEFLIAAQNAYEGHSSMYLGGDKWGRKANMSTFHKYLNDNGLNADSFRRVTGFDTDMILENRMYGIRQYMKSHPNTEISNHMYSKYLEEMELVGVDRAVIQKCRNLNTDYGCKVMLSADLHDINGVLGVLDAEFAEWKQASSGHSKFPPIIDFSTVKSNWYDSTSAYGQGVAAAYSETGYDGSLAFANMDGESVKWALRHELTHSNDLKLGYNIPPQYDLDKIMPKKPRLDAAGNQMYDSSGRPIMDPDIDNCMFVDEFLKAGIGKEHLPYAYNNTLEFIAVASEGDLSKCSPQFRQMLVDFGMPDWQLNMRPKEIVSDQGLHVGRNEGARSSYSYNPNNRDSGFAGYIKRLFGNDERTQGAFRYHSGVDVISADNFDMSGIYIGGKVDVMGEMLEGKLPKGQGVIVSPDAKIRLANSWTLDMSDPQVRSIIDNLPEGKVLTVGRGGNIEVTGLSNACVSGKHLEIRKVDGEIVVRDISTNGSEILGNRGIGRAQQLARRMGTYLSSISFDGVSSELKGMWATCKAELSELADSISLPDINIDTAAFKAKYHQVMNKLSVLASKATSTLKVQIEKLIAKVKEMFNSLTSKGADITIMDVQAGSPRPGTINPNITGRPDLDRYVTPQNSRMRVTSENLELARQFGVDDTHCQFIRENRELFGENHTFGYWQGHTPDDQHHGPWKMHMFSVDEADWQRMSQTLIPYLNEHGIEWKTLSLLHDVSHLNGGIQQGKAFTIYPRDNAHMEQVARDLDYIIKRNNLSIDASDIVGDRQMGDTGRLFYRYEFNSKSALNEILDLSDSNDYAKYKGLYDSNERRVNTHGEGRYLADDMTAADDPWLNFNPGDANSRPAYGNSNAGVRPLNQPSQMNPAPAPAPAREMSPAPMEAPAPAPMAAPAPSRSMNVPAQESTQGLSVLKSTELTSSSGWQNFKTNSGEITIVNSDGKIYFGSVGSDNIKQITLRPGETRTLGTTPKGETIVLERTAGGSYSVKTMGEKKRSFMDKLFGRNKTPQSDYTPPANQGGAQTSAANGGIEIVNKRMEPTDSSTPTNIVRDSYRVVAKTADGNLISAQISGDNFVINKNGQITEIPLSELKEQGTISIRESSTDTYLLCTMDKYGRVSVRHSQTPDSFTPVGTKPGSKVADSGAEARTPERISGTTPRTQSAEVARLTELRRNNKTQYEMTTMKELNKLQQTNSALYQKLDSMGLLRGLNEPGHNQISERLLSAIQLENQGRTLVTKLPEGTSPSQIGNFVADGDVCSINGKLYANDGGQAVELNLSPEKFEELFPPVETAMLQQTMSSRDCWFLSSLGGAMDSPKGRVELYKRFSQVGDDIILQSSGASRPDIKFPGGKVHKSPLQLNGSLGLQMLEQGAAVDRVALNRAMQGVSEIDIFSFKDADKLLGRLSNGNNQGSGIGLLGRFDKTVVGGAEHSALNAAQLEDMRNLIITTANDPNTATLISLNNPGQGIGFGMANGHATKIVGYNPETGMVDIIDQQKQGGTGIIRSCPLEVIMDNIASLTTTNFAKR